LDEMIYFLEFVFRPLFLVRSLICKVAQGKGFIFIATELKHFETHLSVWVVSGDRFTAKILFCAMTNTSSENND